jgi:putative monooxygenase
MIAPDRIDHVALIVDDLSDAVRLLTQLGLKTSAEVKRRNLRAVFLSCGDVDLEVIEILDAEERASRLGNVPARIEHIAFQVPDLDAALVQLEQLGVRAAGPPRDAGRYRMFFTDPVTSDGVVYQFIQVPDAPPRKVHVIRPAECASVAREVGVRTTHLVTAERGAIDFLTGITEFEPGASLPLHTHNCDESVTVIEGTAMFEYAGQAQELQTFETTLVPANEPHRFFNAGDSPMRILFFYGSIAATRTIVETGETFGIGSDRDRLSK